MNRVTLGFNIVPLDGGDTGLRVAFQAGPQAGGGGERTGMEIVIEPIGVPVGSAFNGWTIAEGLEKLAELFGIDAISQISKLTPPAPWDRLFDKVQISPSLRLQPTGDNPSVMLEAQLFETGKAHDSGITIGGEIAPGISIEPEITVYALVAGYSHDGGLDLKARVLLHNPDSGPDSSARPRLLTQDRADPQPSGKPQLVSYPFPTPDQNASASFKLNFLGLGQRFAPTIDVNAPDPLKHAFDLLEATFTSDDPETIINTLVANYYKPDVGWFFALDLDVRGFTVRAVLADPVLYGLEITCESGPFTGLLAEILYQKIGADLGVFYGKIVLPDNIRQINIGAGSATIPSFEIWIYTNGDFKVAIGWPLGPDSFSLQVAIFMGEAGLYFGKLRSGDNPTGRVAPQDEYNPILVIGLAFRIGIGRSFQKGPISAEASLTLQGVFQGLLAWKAAGAAGQGGIAHEPDYYWFSASVTLAGVVQGSVDLGIISASVCIEVWATIATAFETNCNTVVHAEVGVDVSVSIKIVFFTIHIHFSATLDLSFTLISGHATDALVDGPSDPNLRAFIPGAKPAERPRLALRSSLTAAVRDGGTTINLSFMLQPAVPYDAGGAGQTAAVATLLIPSPDPANPTGGTDFEILVDLVTPWLLLNWGGTTDPSWSAVAAALGASGQPGPADFESKLSALLTGVTFQIAGVDLSKSQKNASVAVFPMLDPLTLTVGGTSWNFGTDPLTYSGFPDALAKYFAALSALTPKSAATRVRAAVMDGPDGPSLSHLLYANWFLSMARQIASAMADEEKEKKKKDGGSLAPSDLPTTNTVATIAGMLSRMVLHGSRLPDPAKVHGPSDPITEDIIHPLFSLDYQQFGGTAGAALTASLSLGETGSLNIRFTTGATAVAVLPGGTAPPAPNPGWRGGSGGAPGIAVSAVDPLAQGPLIFSVTARTQGTGTLFPGQNPPPFAQVLSLPASAMPYVAAGVTSGTLRPDTKDTSTPTAFAPGLLVPLALRRVPITISSDLKPGQGSGAAPSEVPPWCPDVYALIGADDDTRDLLEKAMDSGRVRRIVPLTLQSNVLTAATLDLANHPVLAFKSNLSTTSQPNMLMTPMLLLRRLGAGDELGPVSAGLADIGNFLRLVWEASVVHTTGFYLRYQDAQGNGLPDSLFDKDVAKFWLWLDLGDAANAASIPPFANSLVIADTSDLSKSTQYLSLVDANGPVTGWRPAYPPGCVGAQLLWNKPPEGDGTPWSSASVAALYHLVELRIGGGAFDTTLWSTALSPVCQIKDDHGVVQSATYKQVVPVWGYLTPRVTSPYAAVGLSAPLDFRLGDVYGNVLAEPSRQYTAPFPVVYNDPLLGPSTWPGCQAAYDIAKDKTTGAPTLSVVVTFDPTGMQTHAAKLRALENGVVLADESLQSARAVWTSIALQVHDPNFCASVSSTLYGDPDSGGTWPTVGDPTSTLGQLRTLVDTLNAVIHQNQPTKTTASLSLPLNLASISARPSDIFPLGVRLSFARSNVDPGIAAKLPSVKQVDALLPPLLPPPGDPKDPPPLVIWTRQVESVLKGFDGSAGEIKLAQRPMSAADDAGDGPGLWAVRLSTSAGISVAAGEGKPAFFTTQPFSTSLQFGAVAVTTWDGELKPTTATSSAASVDPDLLAQEFLASFDRLMAPDLAAGIARIDGATHKNAFATLMEDKATIASVLSKRLIPIFADQTGGDVDQAVAQFEQSLLAQLSNAYATAAVVQVPLAVSVSGTAEPGAALPPRLFGSLSTAADADAPPYTLTSPKLALDGNKTPWLTFLATVKEPEAAASIKLDPTWTVSYVEHDFEVAEKSYGYLPSGWLKFVAPDATTPSLNVPLGQVEIPVPLRRYPSLPAMVSQVAAAPSGAPQIAGRVGDDPIQDAIRAALRWPLTLTIGKAEQASQDDLWVTSTFNQPIDWRPATTAGPGPMTPLTEALVRFQAGFASISALLPLLEGTDPKAGALIDILVELVGGVVSALTVGRNFLTTPAVERLIWVLRYDEVTKGKLTVFGRVDPAGAATPRLFPVINGVSYDAPPQPADPRTAPDDQPWWVTTYSFGAPRDQAAGGVPKQLVLAISGLDLLVDQTIVASAHVTRNADLGAKVNPLLIYQTPEVFFSNVLAPYVEVTQTLGPMPAAPVVQMLTSVLQPFADVGLATGQQRIVRPAIAYNYPLVTAAGADPLMATIPVLLNAGETLAEDPAPLAQALADALEAWGRKVPLPRQGASFSVSVSLFVTVTASEGVSRPVPLLTVDRIDLMAPAGWPSS